ncbi:MAG: biosynthetic arginine decarboxylase [Bdellovibrionales bacterium]|nr:biosynthetic arginine decarboxylase [Bdellovibrionales bacterium]
MKKKSVFKKNKFSISPKKESNEMEQIKFLKEKSSDEGIKWSIEDSSKAYGVDIWGGDFFTLNSKGHIEVAPQGIKGPRLDLYKIITELGKQHIRLPVLIRFPDIIHAQMNKLVTCFNQAIKEYGYQGQYQGVFPVKVNQQSYVIRDIIKSGSKYGFGLEVGSKPELLIALALLDEPHRIIICNGFKDTEYIQTALLSLKAGMRIFIVVERLEELSIILKTAQNLKVKPNIGFRIKLNTQSRGKWMDSTGFKSKFGLTASEIVQGVEILKEYSSLENLKLLHFHIGSQVPSIHPIKSAIREAARIMTELYHFGVQVEYMDVGGGLGVDYDGSGQSHSSTNYSAQEYANDIVYHLQSICDENKSPHPHIISESGRFLTAPSSLLVFNVMDANLIEKNEESEFQMESDTHAFVKDLYEIYKGLNKNPISESFNDLIEKKKDIHQLFIYGVLNLKEAALAENVYCVAASRLKSMTEGKEDYEEIFQALTDELSDIYFSNFSVFQSLPDSWALGHLFPVMPIHRLAEKPVRRACLADLTCDSDGKIAHFMNYHLWKNEKHLMVHQLKKKEPYYMAAFLTGAYQEILGDMHNLFGDTDAIHVSISKNGNYSVDHCMEGDSIYDILKYVGYHKRDLIEKIHQKTEAAVLNENLSREEAGRLLKNYSQALASYTYLSE